MKRKFATFVLTLLVCLTIFAVAPAVHAAQCSLGNVGGSYGYESNGFVSPSAGVFVPAAASGKATLDGHGNISGKQTRVVAGGPLDETYSGTYTVNSDCTGSFTVLVQPDTRTSTVNLVWTDNTNGASMVFITPGFTLTGRARRITPKE